MPMDDNDDGVDNEVSDNLIPEASECVIHSKFSIHRTRLIRSIYIYTYIYIHTDVCLFIMYIYIYIYTALCLFIHSKPPCYSYRNHMQPTEPL